MKLTKYLAVFSLFALFIACGKSEDQQQAETQQTAADDIRTIEIIGIDAMKFAVKEDTEGITVSDTVGKENDLLRLETISVKPGEQIRIKLTTRSQLPATAMAHNWLMLNAGVDAADFANAAIKARDNDYVPQDRLDDIYAQTGLAAGGQTEEVTFTAPEEPGEYEYICTFPGHFAAGMKGILVVEAPESEQPAE